MSFNKVILIGNLTDDPKLTVTTTGVNVCKFSLAVNRKFAKQGEQSVDYINICAWRGTAEYVSKYAKKGNALLVCGSLQTHKYTNQQNQTVKVTEVVADEVSFAGNRESSKSAPTSNIPSAYGGNSPILEEITDGDDDSLPF